MLTLIRPPDMRTLLEDEIFAKYMRRRPRLPANCSDPRLSPAWTLWLMMEDEKWKRGRFRVYDEAYLRMKKALRDDRVRDAAIVSVRCMFAPPARFKWAENHPWCARCRRPSMFPASLAHRALGRGVITMDDPERCFYCGHRYITLPKYSPS